MQKHFLRLAGASKRSWWLHGALAAAMLAGALADAGQAAPDEAAPGGVVVEEVGKGSALERAGVEPGDLLLAWERLANPPSNPESAAGTLESPFDWLWLEAEQAPRGMVRLVGQRDHEDKRFEVTPGLWQGKVRPRMAGAILEAYLQGQERLESDDLEGAMSRWAEVAESETVRGWMLFRMGETWAEAREWEKAQAFYRSALEEAEEPRARMALWRAVGMAYEKQSAFDKAMQAYESAQELGERTWGEKSLVVADSLNDLAGIVWRLDDLDRAAAYLTRSLEIRQELAPGSLHVASTLNNLAAVVWRRDLDRAADYLTQALEIKQKLAPDSLDVASSLSNLGQVALTRGDPDRAADYFTQALEIKQKLEPGGLSVARSLDNLGHVAGDRGDLDRAADYYIQALEIRQKLAPDSLDVASSLNNLGIVESDRGDLDRAADHHTQALEIRQKLAPGSLGVARSLNNLGIVESDRGDLDRAADYYFQALGIQNKLAPDSLDTARYIFNLGRVAKDRGDLDRAADLYTQSLEIVQKLAPDSLGVAANLNNLGVVARDLGDLDRASAYLAQALEIRQKLTPKSASEAETLYELGRLARQQNKLREATSLFHRALESLEGQIGKLGGSQDAKAGFRVQYKSYYQDQIEVQLGLNQAAEAFHTLERSRAQSFLAQLAERDTVFTADVPEQLDRDRRRLAVRFDSTQQQLAGLNPRDHEAEIKDLNDQMRRLRDEARDIEEKIRRASPKLAALKYPQPLELEAARDSLDPGTLMLAYSVGEESTVLFAVSRERDLRVEQIATGENRLRLQVEAFGQLIRDVRDPSSPRVSNLETFARALYGTLIEPVEDLVEESERVLVLPDGPLHTLPWGALMRESAEGRAQYVAAWKPFHTALSATVYAELRKLRRPARRVQVVAFGDPVYPGSAESVADHGDAVVRAAVQRVGFNWDPLPSTRREVEGIAGVYPPGAVHAFLGSEATEEHAKSLGRDVDIVHFATHGHLDRRFPLNSFLALSIPEDSGEGRENGLLQAWEIFERIRIDADLVVLSACESGNGAELGGEGLIGLTRAFQYAGARSVVATLWSVDDATTAELIVRFYRHLSAGRSKAEALARAQAELIEGPIEVRDDDGTTRQIDASVPFYWAAFQIYGDWQ